MTHLVSLEIGEVSRTFRDDIGGNPHWQPIASAQAQTKVDAKALMLDNVLEALNDESLDVTASWLRLKYFEDNKLVEVETF